MSNIKAGADALSVLNQSDDSSGSSTEFAKFKSGTTYIVKVLGTSDLIQYYNYGIFNKVNSFTAKNPSKKSDKGYPVENLTPWDKAWKYHADKSEQFQDAHSKEANKYRAKQKFAMGFIDLDSGEPIIVDLTKNQAQAVHGAIVKNEKRLDTFAFELEKSGQSMDTVVSMTPYLDDLSDKQQKNFDEAPEEFDMSLFESVLYEADDEEQIELLVKAGFDVSLIGLEKPKPSGGDENEQDGEAEGTDDLPF